MDRERARRLANRLGGHNSVISQVRGVVLDVLAEQTASDAIGVLVADVRAAEASPAVAVVSRGRVILMRAVGDNTQNFSIRAEMLRFDDPSSTVSVEYVTRRHSFSDGLFTQREWVYRAGQAELLLTIDEDSEEEDLIAESALAEAAGWPAPNPTS